MVVVGAGATSASPSEHHCAWKSVVAVAKLYPLTPNQPHTHRVAGLSVTEEVGADTLLGRVVSTKLRAPVGGPADAEGAGVAGHVVTVPT